MMYMIHACPKRMWYVTDFMLPSMLKQGIKEDDIIIYNDTNGDGNLESCLKSFSSVPDDDNGIWHLQDDLLLANTFKEQTELHDEGIVYGWSGYYDKTENGEWYPPGVVYPKQMWSSFQCVRIPNKIARNFVEWFRHYMQRNPVYSTYVKSGKCDDWFFKSYCKSELKTTPILNLAPNIVEHIDHLIGGSSINYPRENLYISRFWEETELYEELKKELNDLGRS